MGRQLQGVLKLFPSQSCVFDDFVDESFGNFFSFVDRNGCPSSIGMAINGVAAALTNVLKAKFFQCSDHLAGFERSDLRDEFQSRQSPSRWGSALPNRDVRQCLD